MFEVFWPEDKFQLLLRCDNPNLREEINPTNVKYFYSSMVRSSLVDCTVINGLRTGIGVIGGHPGTGIGVIGGHPGNGRGQVDLHPGFRFTSA